MRQRLGKDMRVTEAKISVGVDLKFIKAGIDGTYAPSTPSESSVQFATKIEALYREVDHLFNGVSLLIDEIDVLEDKIEIAPLLKAASEKFRLDGYTVNASVLLTPWRCGQKRRPLEATSQMV